VPIACEVGSNVAREPLFRAWQMIVALVMDQRGRPLCCEMWPGNTTDVTALIPVVDRLRRRFGIGRVCVVADRGMISALTLAALEARGLEYVLGVRERSAKEVRTLVLSDDAPFVPLVIPRQGRPDTELEAKAVTLDGRRYIVCRNRARLRRTPPTGRRSWPAWPERSATVTRRWSATAATGTS
jgi:hypothetical protein